jgi:tetratricopeptide (TPR) repeat protein
MLDDADELVQQLLRPRLTPGAEITEGLTVRSRLEELAALVPDGMVQDIWKTEFLRYSGLNLIRFAPKNVDRLERLLSLFDYIHFDPQEQLMSRLALAFAYCCAGRYQGAIRICAEMLPRERELAYQLDVNLSLIDFYCYALRQSGDPQAALAVVNNELLHPPDKYRASAPYLLVARARIHAGLKQWEEVDKDLDEFCSRVSVERMPYYYFAAVCLLHGFVQEERGDFEGAQRTWRQGLYKNFTRGKKQETTRSLLRVKGLLNTSWGLLLASLTNDLSDADAKALFMELDPYLDAHSPPEGQRNFLLQFLPTHILRALWRTPRGHELARRIVYHDLPLNDGMRDVVAHIAVEIARQGAFGGVLTHEQDEVLWEMARACYQTYFGGKSRDLFKDAQVAAMFNIWQDHLALLTWTGLERQLKPELRAGLGYLFGHQRLAMNRPKEAAVFFRSVMASAKPDSPVYRLARADLDSLKALELNNTSWEVVRKPGLAAAAYRQGLLQAQNACRLTPDNGSYLNTLGVAQYRVGDYQSALATLTRSEKLNAVFYKGPFPGDLAFLAMAHHRLGQKEQAQSMLKRLREAIGQPKWKKDEESQAFFREAETLLGLQPSLKN